jgi:putative hemolysin
MAANAMAVMSRFEAGVARDRRTLDQAMRLYGEVSDPESAPRFEPDIYDAQCDHLYVHSDGQVVGACRVLPPRNMKRWRTYRAERDFDLALLIVLRDRMVEIDRPAVHEDYSFDLVAGYLWSALARYLIVNRYDHVFATAGVRLVDGGHMAASMHRMACLRHRAPDDYCVYPRERLPLESLSLDRTLALTPYFRSILEQGAWVCGEPALIREHACADFPLLLPLARMQGREARSFLEKAR